MPALTSTPAVVSYMDGDGKWRTVDGVSVQPVDANPVLVDNRLFWVTQETIEDSIVPLSAIHEALISGKFGEAQRLVLDQLLAEQDAKIARENQAAMDAFWAARPGQPE